MLTLHYPNMNADKIVEQDSDLPIIFLPICYLFLIENLTILLYFSIISHLEE